MTTVQDVIEAIDAEGSTSWLIADAVAALEELDPETGKPLTLKAVSERVRVTRGVEWSPAVLGKYRATASAFPMGRRLPMVSFNAHMELRAHPDKLLKWKPKQEGDVLTVERARALRGGNQASPSDTSPESVEDQARKLVDKLDRLAELEPVLLVDLLTAMVNDWQDRYAKRIGKKRALASVS